jgi:hypothetical protein
MSQDHDLRPFSMPFIRVTAWISFDKPDSKLLDAPVRMRWDARLADGRNKAELPLHDASGFEAMAMPRSKRSAICYSLEVRFLNCNAVLMPIAKAARQ